jgi:hypothetical protein
MKLVAALAVLFVSTAAFADARYKRAQPNVDVPRSERTKPLPVDPPRAAGRPIDANAALAREITVMPIRDDQARILEALAAQTPDGTLDKADVLFRLAELYAKQARAARLRAFDGR